MTRSVKSWGALVFLILACASVTMAANIVGWRAPENAGVNILYCYYKARGVACDRQEIMRLRLECGDANLETADSLCQVSVKCNDELEPVSLTLDELLRCPLPIITHIDGETTDFGTFLMVLAVDGNAIDVINGSNMTVQRMRLQDFRRSWSGVALLPKAKKSAGVITGAIAFAVTLLTCVVYARTSARKAAL